MGIVILIYRRGHWGIERLSDLLALIWKSVRVWAKQWDSGYAVNVDPVLLFMACGLHTTLWKTLLLCKNRKFGVNGLVFLFISCMDLSLEIFFESLSLYVKCDWCCCYIGLFFFFFLIFFWSWKYCEKYRFGILYRWFFTMIFSWRSPLPK